MRLVRGIHRTIDLNDTDSNVRYKTESDWSKMKLGMIDRSTKFGNENSRLSQLIVPSVSHKEEITIERKRLSEQLP